MSKIKVFISSVQNEFSVARKVLCDYIFSDPLLSKFFEPFIFEQLPAIDLKAIKVYLDEIEKAEIYLGILGKYYGFEDEEGISPTEREFDHATLLNKTRFIFITNHDSSERESKQLNFIDKVQSVLVRKKFFTAEELKFTVYSSLVVYLQEKGYINVTPFDSKFLDEATIKDIDFERIRFFIKLAKSKRGFPLNDLAPIIEVLTHLNLFQDGKIKNSAILLFGKEPQRFFLNSEVRCAYFHGNEILKPIPSYKVFKGDLFELTDQSVDFVLSKLNYSVGTRKNNIDIPGGYEIPKEIIAEIIVNAIAHRDYNSNASVQIMLFKDRLEVWNPGSLPIGWTTNRLKMIHNSVPANPMIAEPMFYAGYIERLGTGTTDIVRIAKETGLREPEFIQDDFFRAIIYRPIEEKSIIQPEFSGEVPREVSGEVSGEVLKLILVLEGEMKRSEIQNKLGLKHDDNFRVNYILLALKTEIIQMKFKDIPNHPKQKYFLTKKGLDLKQKMIHNQ